MNKHVWAAQDTSAPGGRTLGPVSSQVRRLRTTRQHKKGQAQIWSFVSELGSYTILVLHSGATLVVVDIYIHIHIRSYIKLCMRSQRKAGLTMHVQLPPKYMGCKAGRAAPHYSRCTMVTPKKSELHQKLELHLKSQPPSKHARSFDLVDIETCRATLTRSEGQAVQHRRLWQRAMSQPTAHLVQLSVPDYPYTARFFCARWT